MPPSRWVVSEEGSCKASEGDKCDPATWMCGDGDIDFAKAHQKKWAKLPPEVCSCPFFSWQESTMTMVYTKEKRGPLTKICFKASNCEGTLEKQECFPEKSDSELCDGKICSCAAPRRGTLFRFADEQATLRQFNNFRDVNSTQQELNLPIFRKLDSVDLSPPMAYFKAGPMKPTADMKVQLTREIPVVLQEGQERPYDCHEPAFGDVGTLKEWKPDTNVVVKFDSCELPIVIDRSMFDRIDAYRDPDIPVGHWFRDDYVHTGDVRYYVNEAYVIRLSYNLAATSIVYPSELPRQARDGPVDEDQFIVDCFRKGSEYEDGECDCMAQQKKARCFTLPTSEKATALGLSTDGSFIEPNILNAEPYNTWKKGWRDLLGLVSEGNKAFKSILRAAHEKDVDSLRKTVKTQSLYASRLLMFVLTGVDSAACRKLQTDANRLARLSLSGLIDPSPEPAIRKIRQAFEKKEPSAWGHVIMVKLKLKLPIDHSKNIDDEYDAFFVVERSTGLAYQLQAFKSYGVENSRDYYSAYSLWAWISGITLYSSGGRVVDDVIRERGMLKAKDVDFWMALWEDMLRSKDKGGDSEEQKEAWKHMFGYPPAEAERVVDLGMSFLITAPVKGNPDEGFPHLNEIVNFLKSEDSAFD